jgi:hypothetical protein
MNQDFISQLITAIVEGETEQAVELTRQALIAGIEPMAIIDQGLIPGMDIVGEKFASGEFFLPNLIISANGMQEAMALLEPELRARQQERKSAGKVVIGTVHGDIHEIGKSLVATMLSANGFQVFDLGVDVPVETFIAKVRDHHHGSPAGGDCSAAAGWPAQACEGNGRWSAGYPQLGGRDRRRWICRRCHRSRGAGQTISFRQLEAGLGWIRSAVFRRKRKDMRATAGDTLQRPFGRFLTSPG